MYKFCLAAALFSIVAFAGCTSVESTGVGGDSSVVAGKLTNQEVETACGFCIYQMEGNDGTCPAAVMIDGKHYMVKGVEPDTHGAGLCEHTGKAVVTGKIVGGEFVAEKYVIVP